MNDAASHVAGLSAPVKESIFGIEHDPNNERRRPRQSIKSVYEEALKDPRWQKRRLKVLEYAHWRCQICGAKDRTLHCHHSYYTRGKRPWQYPDGAIICVCEPCHDLIHGKDWKRVAAPKSPKEEQLPLSSQPADPEVVKGRFAALKKMLSEIPDREPGRTR